MSYEEIECPYCEHAYDLCHDDGAFYEDGKREEEECPNCSKLYLVNSSMHWSYEGEKAECLNDGNHMWVNCYSESNIKNYPALANKQECEVCGRKRELSAKSKE